MKLIYSNDESEGYRRKRWGRGFTYLCPDGARLSEPTELNRIRDLAIPPAYQQVWICPLSNGHLQATGRDAKNRKQYRYHPLWLQQKQEEKFNTLLEFAQQLPEIREKLSKHLTNWQFSKEDVAALALAIIDETGARIGNEAYRRENGTHGITTLRNRHFESEGKNLELNYRGKHGKEISLALDDPQLVKRLSACHDLPGQELFNYRNHEGDLETLESRDVNELLSSISEGPITAKTFRTWRASLIAFQTLRDLEPESSQRGLKKQEVAMIKKVARTLNNTPATCRKYYVHPLIIETWMAGEFPKIVKGLSRLRSFSEFSDQDEKDFARFLKETL